MCRSEYTTRTTHSYMYTKKSKWNSLPSLEKNLNKPLKHVLHTYECFKALVYYVSCWRYYVEDTTSENILPLKGNASLIQFYVELFFLP